MPKISNKSKFMQLYSKIAFDDLLMLELLGENDDKREEKVDAIIEDLVLTMTVAEHSRYTVPFVHYSVPRQQNFLKDVLPYFDENRFKQIVRMNWSNFDNILGLIKDDVVFNGARSCLQLPVETQLIIVLYRLGSSGEGATIAKIGSLFGVGDGGTIQIMTERVFKAVLRLRKKYIYWPDASERKTLVSEMYDNLPNCIGYVDGTEIKLAEKPSEDPEAYFSRKHMYSLKVQGVCDNELRIRHMVLGYPGSVHDARIYNNCELYKKPQEFFTGAEWIAGDSAYKLTTTVITPFRGNSTELTTNKRNKFNKRFSAHRVKIEHCFGILKERFNSLKELKIQIKNEASIKLACRWVLVCAILHNIITMETTTEDTFLIPEEVANYEEEDIYEEYESLNHQSTVNDSGQVKRRALVELIIE